MAVTTNTRQPRSRITRAPSIALFPCDRYGLAPALAGLPADAALTPALPLAPAVPAEPALPEAPAVPDAPLVPATTLASPPLAPALDVTTTGVVGVVGVVGGVVDGVLEPLGANVIAVAPARRPPELRRHSH
jgi:hypothetical protein